MPVAERQECRHNLTKDRDLLVRKIEEMMGQPALPSFLQQEKARILEREHVSN